MKKLLGAVVALTVCLPVCLTTAAAAQPAAASGPSGVPSGAAGSEARSVAQQLVLPHRLAPRLGQDAAGDQTLVTGTPDGHGGLTQLLVRERPAGGEWGADQALTPPARGLTGPTLAVAANGAAVVAWFRSLGGAAYVRVRSASGAWGQVTRLRGIAPYGGLQVVIDADGGTAAVAATQESGSVRIGVYTHGRWSLTSNPGDGTPSIAMDAAGNLYAATSSVQRGGDGDVTIARRSAAGRWSQSSRVSGLGPKPQDVDVRVTPSGRLTLLVGYADPHWRSTYDSESYFTTGYLVLGASRWGRPWQQRWKHSEAFAVDSRLTARGTLRLVYQQWLDRVGRRPTAVALRAVSIAAGGHARPVTLDQQPATLHSGYYETTTALDRAGALHVWWRALPAVPGQPDEQPAGDLHAGQVTFAGPGPTGTDADLPGTALTENFQSGDLLGTSAVEGDAGWVQDVAYRDTSAYGALVTDGTVVVGRAG